ncbi:MAG: hypothetical protein LH660_18870 [Phormidesmis sp. CAN_BIN36]|nr:hypothetical protein [Phormidesmis sp. CAN_BIN36]
MNRQIRPHPSPLPKGEGTRLQAPFSLGRRVGEGFALLPEEGNSYFHSATPNFDLTSDNRALDPTALSPNTTDQTHPDF